MRVQRADAASAERVQAAVAGALTRAGVRAGDRVAFVCPNSAELLCAVLGALRVGVIPVPLNPALTEREQRAVLDDADPALVVGGPELAALLDGPAAELAPVPLGRPMHYTSGTTGRSKGVWSGVLDEHTAVELFEDERGVWELSGDDVLLVCSPLYHSAPLRFSTGVLLSGGSVVVVERFDAATVASAVTAHRPTVAFMVPAHLQRLLASGVDLDLTSFRLLAHAGAPCPPALKRATLDAFPPGSVWEFYGSTEGQFTICSPDEWLARPGTVGRARPGRRLTVDGDGQIWCEAPAFARFEYWRDPAKTAAAWRDGWFTVGDLGRLDDDGYLWLEGRRDDLVISGGVNVYPAEVEAVLHDMHGVQDVAVFGAPDDRWGERVCAAVVGTADASDVIAFCRARLAAYKCPKDVYFVADLPRTGTGKVRRSAIAGLLGLVDEAAERGGDARSGGGNRPIP